MHGMVPSEKYEKMLTINMIYLLLNAFNATPHCLLTLIIVGKIPLHSPFTPESFIVFKTQDLAFENLIPIPPFSGRTLLIAYISKRFTEHTNQERITGNQKRTVKKEGKLQKSIISYYSIFPQIYLPCHF